MVNVAGDQRKYHRVDYTTPKMLVKAFTWKMEKMAIQKNNQVRIDLINNMETLCKDFDIQGFEDWALSNPTRDGKPVFKDQEELNYYLIRAARMKTGDIYCNPKDSAGERFHSPFTNSIREIRDFIRIQGDQAVEIDIKNSQFFFLACLTLHPAASKAILKAVAGLTGNLELMKHYYQNRADYKAFIDNAVDGTLYDYTINLYAQRGKKVTKAFVKDLFLRLFSQMRLNANRRNEF